MNYPIDLEKFKKIIDKEDIKKIDYKNESFPDYSGKEHPLIVFSLNEKHDSCYGQGPTNFAFAWWDGKKKKFISYAYPDEEISYYDFRDVCNHNVGGHSGKVTHCMDAYNLSCLMTVLLAPCESKSGD